MEKHRRGYGVKATTGMLLHGACSAAGHAQGTCRRFVLRSGLFRSPPLHPQRTQGPALKGPSAVAAPQERTVDKKNGRDERNRKNGTKKWDNMSDGKTPGESRARREAEMDARREILIGGIRSAFGDWEAFLRASNSGNLRRFSAYNRLYLYAQNPKANYVATANSWHRIGRRVTDEEWPHPLIVLSPYEYRVEAGETAGVPMTTASSEGWDSAG